MAYKSIGFPGMPGSGSGMFQTGGKVYFVDQVNGFNANTGLVPHQPLATILAAMTLCVADQEDYIFILEHGAAGVEANPVAISVDRVHVIGVGRRGPDPIMRMHGDGNDVFTVTGRDVEIAGLGFDTTGAAGSGIVTAALFGAWIHHCHFAGSSLGAGLLTGIGTTGNQLPWWLIEDCFFNSPNGVGITTECIQCEIPSTVIRRNHFCAAAGGASPCIESQNVEYGQILDNDFMCPISDAGIAGWAISLIGGAPNLEGGSIQRNYAAQTGDNTGNNPYRDTTTGVIGTTLNSWGMNYAGQVVVSPVTA